jgi:hypothetical protein
MSVVERASVMSGATAACNGCIMSCSGLSKGYITLFTVTERFNTKQRYVESNSIKSLQHMQNVTALHNVT